jgi:hypothetical protein
LHLRQAQFATLDHADQRFDGGFSFGRDGLPHALPDILWQLRACHNPP